MRGTKSADCRSPEARVKRGTVDKISMYLPKGLAPG